MYALGIETSCDETSCAVVRNRRVLSNCTVSSLRFHKPYGGVIPEIATRNHLAAIDKVTACALKQAGCRVSDIGVVGATSRPGLIGALVVGLNFAKALSLSLKRPFLGIHHLHAHLFAPFLDNNIKIPFPFMGLVVSGGHTDFFLVKDFDNIATVGSTRDDAAGEVFDKVGRAFGLGYPGGIFIDKLYQKRYKDSYAFKCGKKGLDLSFSGIKTALMYRKAELEKQGVLTRSVKIKLLSSFQETLAGTISDTAIEAAGTYGVKSIVCGGGVVANSRLRELLGEKAKMSRLRLFLAPLAHTSDNGAVVAGLTFYLYNKSGTPSRLGLPACAN